MTAVAPSGIPRASYRLQLHRGFNFRDATGLVPYLAALGISHVYTSPYLKARPGSQHGYDIVDHNAINPEIGSDAGHDAFVAALHDHGMGLILDIVPNHMGVGADNPWWLDVLESGQASRYARFFDIDWQPVKHELRGKVLLPVLGDQYGAVLERAELKLMFDDQSGGLAVHYYEHRFPIDPATYGLVLGHQLDALRARLGDSDLDLADFESLITAFRNLPARTESDPERVAERERDQQVHRRRLAALCGRRIEIGRHVADVVESLNGDPGSAASFDALHALLETQAYRLAYWRTAADEINYRRFFDINDLAGLRMEDPAVFEATHGRIIELVTRGQVSGLRIDHPDGLSDPADYYRQLQQHLGPGADGAPRYVVVEKILASYERLPAGWPVAGTSGYEFAGLATALLTHGPAARAMDRIYQNFIREPLNFDDLLYERKKLIARVSLSSELTVLANQLNRISEADRGTRDFTLTALRNALIEVAACFPVYRTYVAAGRVGDDDRHYVDWAIAQARKRNPAGETGIFDFIRNLLLLQGMEDATPAYRQAALHFAMHFQQYSAPLMAKGMEDTSFYIYNRLVSLNEVGGDPRRFGISVAAFHHANQERARSWPQTMLCTSTHDTKRSGDVRARIGVLSELPDLWRQQLIRWVRINRGHKRRINDQPAPSRNDEYLLYQTLVGIWPLTTLDDATLGVLAGRVEAYMLKAIREAKVHTSWINPNTEYETAVTGFVRALLAPATGSRFIAEMQALQARIQRPGLLAALSQLTLKLTTPGVPDIFQGDETWDFSLVDPDNRRPVDYERRRALLVSTHNADWPEMLRDLTDGRAKLALTRRLLALRGRLAALFRDGDYLPLAVSGARAEHLCAYARVLDEQCVVVIVARWFALLSDPDVRDAEVWGDSRIQAPVQFAAVEYVDVLHGDARPVGGRDGRRGWGASEVLGDAPAAVLVSGSGA